MGDRDDYRNEKADGPRGRTLSRRGLLFGAFHRVREEVSHSASVVREAAHSGPASQPGDDSQLSDQAATSEPEAPRFVARILAFNCIARTGCVSCVEHCRVEGALELVGIKPVVNESACTGCGDCRGVCPAPQPAIEILPKLPPRAPVAKGRIP